MLTHWSYIFLALTHRHVCISDIWLPCTGTRWSLTTFISFKDDTVVSMMALIFHCMWLPMYFGCHENSNIFYCVSEVPCFEVTAHNGVPLHHGWFSSIHSQDTSHSSPMRARCGLSFVSPNYNLGPAFAICYDWQWLKIITWLNETIMLPIYRLYPWKAVKVEMTPSNWWERLHVLWDYQIEAETRWLPFSRRHFQMHFLEWKYMNFN